MLLQQHMRELTDNILSKVTLILYVTPLTCKVCGDGVWHVYRYVAMLFGRVSRMWRCCLAGLPECGDVVWQGTRMWRCCLAGLPVCGDVYHGYQYVAMLFGRVISMWRCCLAGYHYVAMAFGRVTSMWRCCWQGYQYVAMLFGRVTGMWRCFVPG